MSETRILVAACATKDLEQLGPETRRRILSFIAERMTADPPPPNVDVKALAGRDPWLRIRIGDVRILCRPLKAIEGPAGAGAGYLIARIVRRRDLERTISRL